MYLEMVFGGIFLSCLDSRPAKTLPYSDHTRLFSLKNPAILAGTHPFPYPRHLKSSSPQRPMQDNETKGGIFPGKVVIVDNGKL